MDLYFITGMPRSGTTLLSSSLNKLHTVFVPKETHFFTVLWGGLVPRKRSAVRRFLTKQISIDNGISIDDAWLDMRAGLCDVSYYSELIERLREEKRVARVVEKTPNHYAYVQRIAARQHAKVIHVIRDPRDVYLSRQRVPWGRKSIYAISREFNLSCKFVEAASETESFDLLLVKYEDLISNPESILRSVCQFISTEFSASVFDAVATSDFDVSQEAWKAKNLEPFDPENAKKWVKGQDEIWCRFITRYTTNGLIENGYSISGNGVLSFRDIASVALDYVRDLANHIKTRLIRAIR